MRDGGTFGLIATNTIAQGDTRSTGLRWICTHGGEIYHARRRLRWPGQAAVVVSVVHVHRGPVNGARRLDNASTDAITAFLFHRGGHDDPIRLAANAKRSYLGSKIYGQGFTFDDTDGKGVASPLAEHRRLIAADPHNQEAIFPYIGGEEVNTSPTHAHHRYVINFCDYPLRRDDLGEPWVGADDDQRRKWLRRGVVPLDYPYPVAADWPELLAIVEARVKPERLKLGDNGDARRRKEKWWLWGRYTPALFRAITGLNRVLAISQVGQQAAFAMLPSDIVYSHALNVFSDHERKCNRRSVRPMRDAGVSIVTSTAPEPEGVGIVATGKGPDLLLMDVDPLVDITNTRHVAAEIVGSVFLDHRGMS